VLPVYGAASTGKESARAEGSKQEVGLGFSRKPATEEEAHDDGDDGDSRQTPRRGPGGENEAFQRWR